MQGKQRPDKMGFNGTSVKVLILSKDCVYRVAGMRVPLLGETYLAPQGEVKKALEVHATDKPKIILRPFDPRVDGLVLTEEEKRIGKGEG